MNPKGTPKSLMSPIGVLKLDEGEKLKGDLKETKQHICKIWFPNLIEKRNDEKPKIQLKQTQWCWCHLQRKETNKIKKQVSQTMKV